MLYEVKSRTDHLDDGTTVVVNWHPDLPGCYGLGADEEAALESLGRSREAYLATIERMRVEPARPSINMVGSDEVAEAAVSGFSSYIEDDGVLV